MPSPFGKQFNAAQNNEDWEDWLRWDPTAEPTSPDDTFHSGSSKNDSPMQESIFPLAVPGTDDASLISPLIVGDENDGLGFSNGSGSGGGGSGGGLDADFTLFGAGDIDAGFAFSQAAGLDDFPGMTKIDTSLAQWTLPANSAADPDAALSATSSSHAHGPPSSTTLAVTTPSLDQSSPSINDSRNRQSTSSTSPHPPNPAKQRGGRKRKAEAQPESNMGNENGGSQDGDDHHPNKKSTSHNVIEKRYRNNLNDKIVELRNSVPSLRAMGRANHGDGNEDLGGLTPAHKLNKATVMAKATEYIKHLEKRNRTMADEMDALKEQLAKVEAAVGRSRQASVANSPLTETQRSREAPSSGPLTTPNFLNIPQDQSRFGQPVVQQQYMQLQAQPAYARPPHPPAEAQNHSQYANGKGKTFMNKMMLGTMAGIMAMEGYSEHQQSGDNTSGLASFPTVLLKRAMARPHSASSTATLSRYGFLPVVKLVMVVGILLYLLAPLLHYSPRRKHKLSASTCLPKAPSLASPVEVRRQAWLTAIQSVWVPKHFLLEVVAVGAKMFQLSLRRFVGAETFMAIAGSNKEEEAARIKAWDIAIDAQLAGGDAHVSYYRLLLTLMESGTLPDSPARLMQKAVHFRVFFWEVANAGYGNILGFKSFTEKVGRIYWDSARRQQKDLMQARSGARPAHDDDVDILPDHLARLVELDCDEVLSDEMIQRAWNLAWNKPSAHAIEANAAKDSVVEDHAIRSPIDAVAAWYANTTIDDTLADSLSDDVSSFDTEYYLGLALSVAPPASSTHVRALTAKAVLSNSNRKANIVVALEALPVLCSTGGMNLVSHAPASPDVFTALTLAKLISLTANSSPQATRERASSALNGLKLAPGQFTLLTAVAAYRLLRMLTSGNAASRAEEGVEELAGSLRVWAGTTTGRDSGLGHAGRTKIVKLCLDLAKQLGGWDDEDSGYSSADGSRTPPSATCSPTRVIT